MELDTNRSSAAAWPLTAHAFATAVRRGDACVARLTTGAVVEGGRGMPRPYAIRRAAEVME
jgi:hypothetical protein